jgi:hypothetical protein
MVCLYRKCILLLLGMLLCGVTLSACKSKVDAETVRKKKMKFSSPALGSFHVRAVPAGEVSNFIGWRVVRYEFVSSELADLTVSLKDPRTEWKIEETELCVSNQSFFVTCGFKLTKKETLVLLDIGESPLTDSGPDDENEVVPAKMGLGRLAGRAEKLMAMDKVMNFQDAVLGKDFILGSWSWHPLTANRANYGAKKMGPGARQSIIRVRSKEFGYDKYPYSYWEFTLSGSKYVE